MLARLLGESGRRVRHLGEVAPGIEHGVADEIEDGAVELVSAGLDGVVGAPAPPNEVEAPLVCTEN